MKLKKVLAAALAAAMLATMALGCGSDTKTTEGGDAEVVTLKLGLVDNESTPYYKGAMKIAEKVEAATDGKVKIEVIAGGALGGERDMVDAAAAGDLDIATAANSVVKNYIEEMAILDQAYLWTDSDQAHAAVDGPVGDLIEEAALAKGLHVLGYMESGFRNVFSVKPIKTMADFNGVKIRTMENDYHMAAFEAFGALPVAMAAGEQFNALQTGAIDACENAVSNCWNNKFYDITKNITWSNHAYVYILVCMSDAAWNKIPEDLRDAVAQAIEEGAKEERQYLIDANEEAVENLKGVGVEFHDIDVAGLQKAYQDAAAAKGFTFDADWQAAVDEVVK